MKHDRDRLDLFLAHRAALVDYATPILGDRSWAEDVVQEAYLRFVPSGAAIEQPVAYLYRVVRNLALDRTRRRALELRLQAESPAWWCLPPAPRTPEQEAMHRLDLARVSAALAALPADARAAVEMHRFEGRTLQEIAGRLGLSVTSAHRLVRGALIAIAERLEPDGDA